MISPETPMASAFSSRAVCKIFSGGDHHAEIGDGVAVALEDDAHDVLADVVHIALHRGEDDVALGFGEARRPLRFEEGHQPGRTAFFITRADFTT